MVVLFLVTQLIGLTTVNQYIEVTTVRNETTGMTTTQITHPPTAIGPAPKVENKSSSYLYIVIGVLLGTALLFVFIKFNIRRVWKYWFLLSVIVTLAVAFHVYAPLYLSIGAAILLGWWKVNRPNVLIHNFTEIFIYTGIAIIFISILNLVSAVILLLVISVYDMIAVWKSKHMITLAKFQTDAKVFAGLFIPYKREGMPGRQEKPVALSKKISAKKIRALGAPASSSEGTRNAILGGGDIAFPLLFSSAVMEHLIEINHLTKSAALGLSGIIAVITAIALLLLLVKAKADKFYPAMPFITLGCFVGYGIILLFL